jgi:signal transduction histidine kinase
VNTGRQRAVRFGQLQPGDYSFHVSAANQDGLWHETGASLAFKVLPFFWQTAWFRAAMVLVLMASGGGAVWGWARARIRHAQERERLARAEASAQQRLNELTHLSRVNMLGELSGSIAHELNQPLTSILSNAQAAQRYLAKNGANLGEVREILADIVSEDERAGEVIKRLRLLIKNGEVHQQTIEPNELVLETLKLVRGNLANQGVSVETALTPDGALIRGDRVQLQQVLLNLVMNASDAMAANEPKDRRLTLRTLWDGNGALRIEVSDVGRGLPEGELDRVFEHFFTTKPHGLGLGLSVCRTIVTAHGGIISAISNPTRGATFHFTVPLAKEPQA